MVKHFTIFACLNLNINLYYNSEYGRLYFTISLKKERKIRNGGNHDFEQSASISLKHLIHENKGKKTTKKKQHTAYPVLKIILAKK